MAQVGRINVDFVARTSKFAQGVSAAVRKLNVFKLASMAASAAMGVARAAMAALRTGAIALGVGLAGVTYGVKKAMASLDALGKLSDRIGADPAFLRGLQFGAEQSGLEVETLNKSLEIYAKNIFDAARGSAEMNRVFQRLGLNAKTFSQLSIADQVKELADRFRAIPNELERINLARTIFGRGGGGILTLLQNGREGINAFLEEAEKLGLAFNRVDLAKVEAANDAINRLKKVFEGLFGTLAIEVAPMITHIAKKIEAWATSGEGAATRIIDALKNMGIKALETVDGIIDGLNTLRVVFADVGVVAADSFDIAIDGASSLAQKMGYFAESLIPPVKLLDLIKIGWLQMQSVSLTVMRGIAQTIDTLILQPLKMVYDAFRKMADLASPLVGSTGANLPEFDFGSEKIQKQIKMLDVMRKLAKSDVDSAITAALTGNGVGSDIEKSNLAERAKAFFAGLRDAAGATAKAVTAPFEALTEEAKSAKEELDKLDKRKYSAEQLQGNELAVANARAGSGSSGGINRGGINGFTNRNPIDRMAVTRTPIDKITFKSPESQQVSLLQRLVQLAEKDSNEGAGKAPVLA